MTRRIKEIQCIHNWNAQRRNLEIKHDKFVLKIQENISKNKEGFKKLNIDIAHHFGNTDPAKSTWVLSQLKGVQI